MKEIENKIDLVFIDLFIILCSILFLEMLCFVFIKLIHIKMLYGRLIYAYFDSVVYIVIPVLYAKWRNKNYLNQISFLGSRFYFIRNCLLGIFAGFVLAFVVHFTPLFNQVHSAPLSIPGVSNNFLFYVLIPLTILGFQSVVLGPISEELVHRGLYFNWFKNHMNVWWALFLQAIVFSIFHFNISSDRIFYDFIYYLFVGLIIGYLYEKTSSLLTSICCHGVFNYLIISFGYLLK
jgi:membrane protease YdiL (CAAX protease family)